MLTICDTLAILMSALLDTAQVPWHMVHGTGCSVSMSLCSCNPTLCNCNPAESPFLDWRWIEGINHIQEAAGAAHTDTPSKTDGQQSARHLQLPDATMKPNSTGGTLTFQPGHAGRGTPATSGSLARWFTCSPASGRRQQSTCWRRCHSRRTSAACRGGAHVYGGMLCGSVSSTLAALSVECRCPDHHHIEHPPQAALTDALPHGSQGQPRRPSPSQPTNCALPLGPSSRFWERMPFAAASEGLRPSQHSRGCAPAPPAVPALHCTGP